MTETHPKCQMTIWLCQVIWQIKNLISHLPQDLWTPALQICDLMWGQPTSGVTCPPTMWSTLQGQGFWIQPQNFASWWLMVKRMHWWSFISFFLQKTFGYHNPLTHNEVVWVPDYMIPRGYLSNWKLICKAYGHQVWQGGDLK